MVNMPATSVPTKSPSETLCVTDGGDDMQRRCRYQAMYAALASLGIFDERLGVEEVFCEHHEDTLIKRKDGTFVGVQVKTRVPGRDLFKAGDEQVMHSIERFVAQEVEYPGHYSRFVLATNYAFWSEKENGSNLWHLLELARDARAERPSKVPTVLSAYLKKLVKRMGAKRGATIDGDTILRVLSKVEIEDSLPKFDDMDYRLARKIPDVYKVSGAGIDDLVGTAKALISRMFDAAALHRDSSQRLYFALCEDPAKARVDDIIEGKRITREVVEQVLNEHLSQEALLSSRNKVSVVDLPRGMTTLSAKMSRGKISSDDIEDAKDHKFSAEKYLDAWIYKYSPEEADKRYDQMSVIVRNECREAYDLAFTNERPFGLEMLKDVRQRLRNRLANEPNLFFGCTYEHLLGIAGILAELCDVWWSERFDIQSEAT